MAQVQLKSPTYTLLWQFFNTNKLKNIYYLLLHCTTFQGYFKIGRALHSYTKTMKHFTDQIQDGRRRLFRYWKKPASAMVLQKFILVNLNLRCLYKDNLKKIISTILCLMHIWTKKHKNNLTSSPEIADKVLFYITEHRPLVAKRCFIVDCYFKLFSFFKLP